jgi:hypothetical protein
MAARERASLSSSFKHARIGQDRMARDPACEFSSTLPNFAWTAAVGLRSEAHIECKLPRD